MPRSLRQPVRQLSTQARRKPCRLCHNLDPRSHSSSLYNTESDEKASASLSLVLDALDLGKTKDPKEGGCRFCGVLVQALDAFLEGWRGTRQRVLVDIKEKGTVKVGIDGDKWKREQVEIYTGSVSRAPWPTLGTAHRIPVSAGSDDTFDFIRRCIQDCLTNRKHVACKLPSSSSLRTPKRLLDVGRVTAPIRLIDTQGKTSQYAALSHCWGTGPTLTATKSNWQKLSRNIPFEALPPLFQDAIIITRQLGLRYIWIDSLCIIQDSVRDWETESSKMGHIYENSYVTISATHAADGSDRCLLDRLRPVVINYQNTTGKDFAVRARKVEGHHPDLQDHHPAKPFGPLTTRAWALQEHVLSTRILHYTATELLFECRTSFRCECSPARRTYPTTPALIPKAKIAKNPGAVWTAWHQIVETYSKRNLTMQNDKLPAISGIASTIKGITKSSYLAGLWQDVLALDLLWFTSSDTLPDAHYFAQEKYRAPSFSWASLNVPVAFYEPNCDEMRAHKATIDLISTSVAASQLNPLGAVSDASIKLRGPTMDALLSSMQREGMWEYSLLVKGRSALNVAHDCLLVGDNNTATSEMGNKTVRRAYCGDKPSEFKIPVLCLSVARYDTWMSGLVLGHSTRVVGSWERLGTFSAGLEVFQGAVEKEVVIS